MCIYGIRRSSSIKLWISVFISLFTLHQYCEMRYKQREVKACISSKPEISYDMYHTTVTVEKATVTQKSQNSVPDPRDLWRARNFPCYFRIFLYDSELRRISSNVNTAKHHKICPSMEYHSSPCGRISRVYPWFQSRPVLWELRWTQATPTTESIQSLQSHVIYFSVLQTCRTGGTCLT